MLKYSILFLATCLLLPRIFAQPVSGRRRGSDDFFEFDDHRRDDDFSDDRFGSDDSHRISLPLMQDMFEDNPFLIGRQFGPPPPPPPFILGPPRPPPPFLPGPPPPPPFFPGPPPVLVGGPPPPFFPGPPPPPPPVFLGGPPPPFFPAWGWYPSPDFYPETMPANPDCCKCKLNYLPGPQISNEAPFYNNKGPDYGPPKPFPVEYNTEQNRPYNPPSPAFANKYEYPRGERPSEVSYSHQPPSHNNEARPPYEEQKYPVDDFLYERRS